MAGHSEIPLHALRLPSLLRTIPVRGLLRFMLSAPRHGARGFSRACALPLGIFLDQRSGRRDRALCRRAAALAAHIRRVDLDSDGAGTHQVGDVGGRVQGEAGQPRSPGFDNHPDDAKLQDTQEFEPIKPPEESSLVRYEIFAGDSLTNEYAEPIEMFVEPELHERLQKSDHATWVGFLQCVQMDIASGS
jgi:hypothetical protein